MLMRTAEPERTAPVVGAALAIAVVGAATILGAYYFEYVLHYQPCQLCLEQRIPYYVAIPLALVVALAARLAAPRPLLIAGFAALALAMAIGEWLAVYHAGVEWHWWPGPQECSGDPNFGRTGSLLDQLKTVIIARCDEAAWRLFGLSLAGYNAVIAAALACVALWGLRAAWRHGSSSVSQ
ncbi:MAG TPA: disulfide bond formation protein B [Xanthobacteraceae bacterium]|jgi:disulfide bond formation protein DsbB|nr:disulfide bond formation protein B [Xanthobacteraceae bacterium]